MEICIVYNLMQLEIILFVTGPKSTLNVNFQNFHHVYYKGTKNKSIYNKLSIYC
jgi:hypothetical protein